MTGLTESMVPNHDALDAACAALVAGLHRLGLTVPFGKNNDGGQLWMPDGVKLAALLPSSEEAPAFPPRFPDAGRDAR